MKGLESMIRLQKWHVDEKRRQVGEMEGLLIDLKGRAKALEDEILREQDIAAEAPLASSYGFYAQAAIQRRETIQKSIAEIVAKIEIARDELSELFQEMKRYEIAHDRRLDERAYKARKIEQAELDEIGLDRYRRALKAI